MLISESWLKTWLDTNLSVEKISDVLTMAGIEVDNVESLAPNFSKVVLGRVIKVNKHPNADRLKVCIVDIGEKLEIVCGASNVTENMFVACATDGASLPGGAKIRKTKMRGVASSGMLCSEKELGISSDSIGIMDVKNFNISDVGKNIRELLNLDEKIMTLKITPNRGDCLSIRGLAREIATSTKCKLKNPIIAFEEKLEIDKSIPVPKIKIHNKDLCGRFSSRILMGVDSGVQTPDWIVQRLKETGQRSISVLVDISNYVMIELGRPSHIFDYDKIKVSEENTLEVRWARSNEEIELLTKENFACNSYYGVISDEEGPVALAGIMGGEKTAVNKKTKNILIETAYWLPDAIRGRAQKSRILTEASHRFERGVDYNSTVVDLEIISNMIQSICGGKVGAITDHTTNIPNVPEIVFRKERCEKILGMGVSNIQIKQIFESLGFLIKVDPTLPDENYLVTPPPYRFDIHIEEDLIEEVVRMIGYNSIPTKPPLSLLQPKVISENVMDFNTLKDLMVVQDFYEVINYGFIDSKMVDIFTFSNESIDSYIELINPISTNMSVMRHSLIPGLINNLSANINNQQKRVRIFELGRSFKVNNNVVPDENSVYCVQQPYQLGALIYGPRYEEQWAENEEIVDFFDLKKVLENLCKHFTIEFKKTSSAVSFLHPGRSALVKVKNFECSSIDSYSFLGNGVIGYIGELHPRLSSFFDFPSPPIIFEIALKQLLQKKFPKFKKISKVPVVRRDLAFIVSPQIEAGAVIEEVLSRKKDIKFGNLLVNFEMFDVYKGKGISNNKKSLAFMVLLQDTEKTLEESIVDSLVEEIVKIVENKFSAKLRS
ncbi:MAG: phenylalanine--tRNA ligase subunit beta [Burkholderiaceae bacterium]